MTVMIASNRAELEAAKEEIGTGTWALVPTMGALHDGHRSLFRVAHQHADHVMVSIFVNPLQFGPNEDFSRYPRQLNEDVAVCAEDGVAVVYAPRSEDMYPAGRQVGVSPGDMGTLLEGACRPGFFDGVLTVVMKLFNQARPDVAVFGRKDAQQLAMVRRMVSDLDLDIRIEAGDTVRDPDGMAISSRNAYLSPAERETALALSRALAAGRNVARAGAVAVRAAAEVVLEEAAKADPPLKLDYMALVDATTFTEVGPGKSGQAVLAVAGSVGTTRLIDNTSLTLG